MTLIEFNHKFLSLTNSLERFAFCLTYDKKTAQALLYATFLKALKNRNRLSQGHNFKAWLYVTMHHVFLKDNYWGASQTVAWDDDYFKGSGADDADLTFAAKALGQHLEHLKGEYLKIFKMHLEGLKYNEIADELNITPETVKNRIFFSRKALMDRLKG
jgi:RNA polymerase sigma-70 factor (ECF subfamily)